MAAVIETHKIIELSDCTLETKALLPGVLLKWMDITSCLAAEKLANVPCVTLFVDDLQIDRIIQLGQIINIKAWVNRAYHTSMEVEVLVNSEDASFTERTKICQAYFTFVTQRDENGEKNVIPPVTPATETEKVKFALAGERKKIRLDNHSSLTSITVTDEEFQQYEESQNNNDGGAVFVIPGDTYCECIELVLPQHANHHQTTFGGQLMEWMEQAVSISARRLCRGPIKLLTVDEVFFRAPSKVGDRIVMKACVNKTFGKSMEVGVRVEAYAVGGPTRHIQSAYFTFISPDGKGNPKDLPKMKPMNKVICYETPLSDRAGCI